jgi:hypothetical protein
MEKLATYTSFCASTMKVFPPDIVGKVDIGRDTGGYCCPCRLGRGMRNSALHLVRANVEGKGKGVQLLLPSVQAEIILTS